MTRLISTWTKWAAEVQISINDFQINLNIWKIARMLPIDESSARNIVALRYIVAKVEAGWLNSIANCIFPISFVFADYFEQ